MPCMPPSAKQARRSRSICSGYSTCHTLLVRSTDQHFEVDLAASVALQAHLPASFWNRCTASCLLWLDW